MSAYNKTYDLLLQWIKYLWKNAYNNSIQKNQKIVKLGNKKINIYQVIN